MDINSTHSLKVLTTSQPDYLHNLISVQFTCRTRSSSAVTLARPSASSSLQITNRSSFRQPHSVLWPPDSPHPVHITSSQSPPLLSPSITPDLKRISFTNPFLSSIVTLIPSGLPPRILNLYWTKWALTFVCFRFFLATCARISWSLSFLVHVNLFFRIVSHY